MRAGGVADGGSQTGVGDGDGAGGVTATVTVQSLDEILSVLVGDGQGSDSDGLVVLGPDQPARPG